MILTAFKTNPEATNVEQFRLLPRVWQWVNFRTIFEQQPMATFYINSVIYTTLRILPSIFFAALTGFAIAKMPFRGKGIIWFRSR